MDEQMRRTVVRMLVPGVRQHDERRVEDGDQAGELAHQIVAPIHRPRNQLLGRWRRLALCVGRGERAIGWRGAREQTQPLVRKAEQANPGAADAQPMQRMDRFTLAQRSVQAIRNGIGVGSRIEGRDAFGEAVAAGHLNDPHRATVTNDPLNEAACRQRGIVGMGRNHQRPYRANGGKLRRGRGAGVTDRARQRQHDAADEAGMKIHG